ncbi:MAG TPA: hypothetical protein VM941_06315 [Pyrinomonadaceae bacterium]|jgi:hypothetical protein|nr:hypothetical protein [Pyrinomonadaceae bacterium]
MQTQLPTIENTLLRPDLNLESTKPELDPPEGQGGTGGGGSPAPEPPEEEAEEDTNP